MSWTAERIETLGKLWADGHSASQIAKRLGGLTRNAVIGKVHRLGLAGRRTRHRSTVPQVRTRPRSVKRRQQVSIPRPVPVLMIDSTPEPASLGLSLLDLNANTCKWPHGDPLGDFSGFCGHDAVPGSSYCHHHHRRAHNNGPAHGR